MQASRQDEAIVRTIIELGHRLGLHVVAEGAEIRDAVAALTTLGCDAVQGFIYTPPLNANDTLACIRQHAKLPLAESTP
jgi:EAL domain-containing protein (putative c-di-GMP-specific phosphodiesterase class I)